MTEPAITPELVAKHNLTPEEYAHAREILGGREPKLHRAGNFFRDVERTLQLQKHAPAAQDVPDQVAENPRRRGRGKQPYINDIGDGLAIAFKIESHNHPSAVEPFQARPPASGGIVRDIFTMGARPVCAVNWLRLGPITTGSDSEFSSSKSENRKQ